MQHSTFFDLYPNEERNVFLANSSFLFNTYLQKIPLNYSFSRPVCEGYLMQHMKARGGKEYTTSTMSVLHPCKSFAIMGCICCIWTYPEARMEKKEHESQFSLANAFCYRCTEMLLFLKALTWSPLL